LVRRCAEALGLSQMRRSTQVCSSDWRRHIIASMAKRRPPEELEPIPAELVLGQQDLALEDEPTDAAGDEPLPQRPHAPERAPRTPLTRGGDRIGIAAVLLVIVAAGTLYLYRGDIRVAYERSFYLERYWSAEVKLARLIVAINELEHQVDSASSTSGERAEEPILAAKEDLYGVSPKEARSSAAAETASHESLCNGLARIQAEQRERLTTAERELARLRSK
jgi:hypothetical protein